MINLIPRFTTRTHSLSAFNLRTAQPQRSLVILPYNHPFEYFKKDYQPRNDLRIVHPEPFESTKKTPLYFQITLKRSIIGMHWQKRYWLGVLFKKFSPLKRLRPRLVRPKVSVNTVIFREATPDVMDLILESKEALAVKNIWTEEEYREIGRKLLKAKALTDDELQVRRGYYKSGSLVNKTF
jgi:hypothetical protein